MVSNYVHLLIYSDGRSEVISRSIQLIARRTAQEYNNRKNRKGVLWEDRYHVTAVDTDDHLIRCLMYIDFRMIRAEVVTKYPRDGSMVGIMKLLSQSKDIGSLPEIDL